MTPPPLIIFPILSPSSHDSLSHVPFSLSLTLSLSILPPPPPLFLFFQTALCDRSEEVRALAAKGFNTLFKNIGPRAVEDVVPALLLRLKVPPHPPPTHKHTHSTDTRHTCDQYTLLLIQLVNPPYCFLPSI